MKGSVYIQSVCSIKNNTKHFRTLTDFQVHEDNQSAVKIYESYNTMHKDRFNIQQQFRISKQKWSADFFTKNEPVNISQLLIMPWGE